MIDEKIMIDLVWQAKQETDPDDGETREELEKSFFDEPEIRLFFLNLVSKAYEEGTRDAGPCREVASVVSYQDRARGYPTGLEWIEIVKLANEALKQK